MATFEIIAPSRMGLPVYALILNFLFICVLCSIALGVVVANAPILFYAILVGEIILFGVVPVIRLLRLISESNQYTRNSAPPVWKAGL